MGHLPLGARPVRRRSARDLNAEYLAQVQQCLVEPGPEILWALRQAGCELRLEPWRPAPSPEPDGRAPSPPSSSIRPALATGAPLAWLRARRPQFRLESEAPTGRRERYDFISLGSQSLSRRLTSARRLTISSDSDEVELVPRPRPVWAKRFGQDPCGMFAEFDLDGVPFRLRWISPGSFLMGSPEDEAGRFGDESPRHLVTISKGFWLAETLCTQAQWQAVMGNNPSQFREPYDPKRPVEQVSWEDCGQFCARLRERVPDLDFRLPTEAEWEYACRAGTTSAFNDGSACTEPSGQDPALHELGWYEKNSENKTHPVAEKRRNAWGVYDMHGNVWEWCADRAENKGGSIITDTYVDGAVDPVSKDGSRRVVRGGCYWSNARLCRSAYRLAGGPGIRDWIQGFRLAAGQPPERGAPSQEAAGAAAPGPEAPAGRPASGASRPPKKMKLKQ